jgi:hypothetical protein
MEDSATTTQATTAATLPEQSQIGTSRDLSCTMYPIILLLIRLWEMSVSQILVMKENIFDEN